ncbi:hypothetical protein RSAG8_06761, partial [Rhizoctonia solani AG-8 WAC10335]
MLTGLDSHVLYSGFHTRLGRLTCASPIPNISVRCLVRTVQLRPSTEQTP